MQGRVKPKSFCMKREILASLYLQQLRDLYSTEQQLLTVLPRLASAATAPALRTLLEAHLAQTYKHVTRLEVLLELVGAPHEGLTDPGIIPLLQESEAALQAAPDPDQMDAALIAAAQRLEHYEIAGYGCVRTYAELLGEWDAAQLLQATLDEEEAADDLLTDLAESSFVLPLNRLRQTLPRATSSCYVL